jgi:hypothetical protein
VGTSASATYLNISALSTVTTAIGDGQIIPTEGETLANVLVLQGKVLQQGDFDRRLQCVEQKLAGDTGAFHAKRSVSQNMTKELT